MAFTFIASATGTSDVSGTSLNCSSTLNIQAGDLIVALVRWEATSTTPSIAGVTNSLTMVSTFSTTAGIGYAAIGYKIAASTDAAETFIFTLAAARTYRRIIAMQFRPDAGDTVTLDASVSVGQGTSTTAISGNITTTGTDEVVVGAINSWSSAAITSPLINSVAADGSSMLQYAGMLYRILTATFSNGAAQATVGNSYWAADIIAFKSEATAGGLSMPVAMNQYRQRWA